MRLAFPALVPLLTLAALLTACSSSNTEQPAPQRQPDAATGDDGGAADTSTTPDTSAGGCSAALADLMRPVNRPSKGDVTVLSDTNGVKTIYVDASAGGTQAAESNPRVYVSLATASRVDVSDVDAAASTSWDLALKRAVLFTNDGSGGTGHGAAAHLTKAFDAVTSADAAGAEFVTEAFVDKDCNPQTDAVGDVLTSFTGWYDYNEQQHTLAPHAGTYLVKSASGALFKVAITSYYATADGGTSTDGGHFVLQVSAL